MESADDDLSDSEKRPRHRSNALTLRAEQRLQYQRQLSATDKHRRDRTRMIAAAAAEEEVDFEVVFVFQLFADWLIILLCVTFRLC